MIHAYRLSGARLEALDPATPLSEAIWIDLCRPDAKEAESVGAAAGVEVPTLADMEEIEISNRFYREPGWDALTVILPGREEDDSPVAAPAAFLLSPSCLVTVRHHRMRSFETFPARADRSSTGCGTPQRLFLGLVEEIVSRLADHLEAAGRALDGTAARIYAGSRQALLPDELEESLRSIGREGETVARVRLSLLSVERMLSIHSLWTEGTPEAKALRAPAKTLTRDIQALEVHADFLAGRVGLATDTTLGMVNLSQNASVRMMSVVAALFLPPTLIASVYGMNFARMPELGWAWGYPASLAAMVLSSVATWAWFRWKGWL